MSTDQNFIKKRVRLIGSGVTVYDRYLFAVPVRGTIVDIAEKDGAYSVNFFEDNPGGKNVTKHNGKFFHHQQCRVDGDVSVCDFKSAEKDISVSVRWHDGYLEEFECSEVRFGSDLLWMHLKCGKNRHIPLRSVRWFSQTPGSHQRI